jgi:hypothetical protein
MFNTMTYTVVQILSFAAVLDLLLYFVFALAERKNEIQISRKYQRDHRRL